MRSPKNAVVCFCFLVGIAPCSPQPGTGTRTDEQTATDGITKGWLQTQRSQEPGQEWRTYSQELDIARNGRITRRFTTQRTYVEWGFWAGGRQIALEEGGTHGPTVCELFDLRSKRRLTLIEGCNDGRKNKPAWASAVLAREEKSP